MKTENVVLDKSYAFAVRIVKLYKHLAKSKSEYILAKQVLRSGTSIGANIEEAMGGLSRADFSAKLAIAYKEARETAYWLRLLKDADCLTQSEFESIFADAEEILRIITAIQKSTKSNSNS